jgi:molybdopterin/thiamine biosynthesis adenylyltransferase
MPSYADFFGRNLGVVTAGEQERLRHACVGIAGNGGVGGAYAITLARMGVGAFHLADFDVFEAANFNRQQGATLASLGRPKTEVLREMILAINPEARVTLFPQGITAGSLAAFLAGSDLVMDGLDFYALPARRLLFPAAEARGIPVVTSGPIGLTTTLHVFGPGAMPFEEYFDFASCRNRLEELSAFVAGVTPALLQLGQIDVRHVDYHAQRAPSFATAIQLCAGLASTEALRILLGRGTPFLAPRYFQFDPVRLRLAKGRLFWGNRHPLQRLKRRMILRQLTAAATAAPAPGDAS